MKKKLLLTIVFALSLTPMLLSQYGGMRGVQEISGLMNLTSPIGLIALVLFIIGVWTPFENQKTGWIFGLLGTIGMVVSEIYNYLTWYVMTITGEIRLEYAVEFAFPEFYFGLFASVAMIGVYIHISKESKER